ncbi:lysophospholipid acyltransferase family protein [Halobacillus rhizosphaerae]|uniref:lysophospholipid acyltransferase family protein n=1 Tax=Halobacillus rhizosphaerae TaxID=3064889 RepID=UPI00398B7EDF
MLKTKKNSVIEWGFKRFNRKLLNRNFQQIRLSDNASLQDYSHTLFFVNHSTWWDPLLIYYLNDQIIHSDGYGMMHEDGIKKFPFFRKIGAYSINTDHRRHIMDSLSYSISLLNNGKSVWIFPQGEEQHLEKRPLQFFQGLSYIAARAHKIKIIPISLYYSLEHTKKPNAYIKIGSPIAPIKYENLNRKETTRLFEEISTSQLDDLKKLVVEEDHQDFRSI